MTKFEALVTQIGDSLWTYLLIAVLLGCGIAFTILTKGVQFRQIGEMLRLLLHSSKSGDTIGTTEDPPQAKKKHISSFQAFAVAMAGRVGTGNIAGVATAIFVGGPGAVFWMWVTALLGAATSFVECTLAQLFKRRSKDSFIGGPAYYMMYGLGKRWMGVIFASLMIFTFGFANNSIQSNTICEAWSQAFGVKAIWIALALVIIVALIIFGGIQRIAHVSSAVVPFMALIYLGLALFVIAVNIGKLPGVLKLIVENAFGIGPAIGGGVGTAIMQGVRRGLFSNEAGEGSTPNAAATAKTSHPAKQGLIQSLGVFVDTILVCSCTAFIILLSGVGMDANGVRLTQNALSSQVGGWGDSAIAIVILLFAFSTILGNYYYGEANMRFISKKSTPMLIYRLFVLVMIFVGTLVTLDVCWATQDILMGLLTASNLIAVVLLSKYSIRLLKDYQAKKKNGIKEPAFHASDMPDIADKIDGWE